MWQRRKFIIIPVVVAAALLVGSIGVAVLAEDGGGTTIWDRVGAIYQQLTGNTLDQEALKTAFEQARDDMRAEALQNWLDKLVEEGKITQQQADDYLEWWQARPDMPYGFGLGRHGMLRGLGGDWPMPGE